MRAGISLRSEAALMKEESAHMLGHLRRLFSFIDENVMNAAHAACI